MHASPTAGTLWQAWCRLEEERAQVLAKIERLGAVAPPAVVTWGRHSVASLEEIRGATPPGWVRLDSGAAARHQTIVDRLAPGLAQAQQIRRVQCRALGLPALEAHAADLTKDAKRLAQAIRRAPITGPVDVIARLDIIAAMWGPVGEIAEPGAPLVEVLALMEALGRISPKLRSAWRRRRARVREMEGSGHCPPVPASARMS